VFELNPTPPGDAFVPLDRLTVPQPSYPLVLSLCEGCGYLHLPFVLSPSVSYTGYLYVTKITLGLANHYQEYADRVVEFVRPAPGALAVDIGSNDGTMLESFKRRGLQVLGVEPARGAAEAAIRAGIPTLVEFFDISLADSIVRDHGRPAIVTANYMYANIDEVSAFTNAIAQLLAEDGVFVVQTGYHPEQMKINMFDYIYHEHFSYFTVRVLRDLFARCGLVLVHAEKQAAKGGSVRVIAQRAGGRRGVNPSVDAIIKEEDSSRMAAADTYREFAVRINRIRTETRVQLDELRARGLRIAGYGASHSTTTLLYHFELAPYLEYLVDDNTVKHGMYSPGYHLPVYPSDRLYEDKPDVVVVLAWQYTESILNRNRRFVEQGGTFVVPLPALRMV
jgi:hypothetical protein